MTATQKSGCKVAAQTSRSGDRAILTYGDSLFGDQSTADEKLAGMNNKAKRKAARQARFQKGVTQQNAQPVTSDSLSSTAKPALAK